MGLKQTLAKAIAGRRFAENLPARMRAVLQAHANPATFPTMVQIEPSRRCNLACAMCSRTHVGYDKQPDMTLDTFKSILSQFPPDLKTVNIQGLGEPLLNPDIIEMIEYACGLGYETRFNTNLLRLSDEMAEKLVSCGHTEVQVSIETVDPELYADIRRGGDLERVRANLARLAKAKERAGSDTPEITVHAILMKCVLPGVPELVRTLKEWGVSRMHFADLCTFPGCDVKMSDGELVSNQALHVTMSEDEIWEAITHIKELEDDSFKISVPGDWGGLRVNHAQGVGVLTCIELWEMPFVTCDGYMTPCCWAPHQDIFNMGSFSKQTFEHIWFGKAYHKLRMQHLTNKHPKHCRKCPQLIYTACPPSLLRGKTKPAKTYDKFFLGKR